MSSPSMTARIEAQGIPPWNASSWDSSISNVIIGPPQAGQVIIFSTSSK